jgi:beta-lactamase superfamily II metal-dependent hydrolase
VRRPSRGICALVLSLLLQGCSTTGPISTVDDDAELAPQRLADGPPQRGNAPGPVQAARPDASARAHVGPTRAAITVFPAALPTSQANADQMVAHFIDVGQGDATLLEFSCGAVLIDTGGERTDDVTGRDRLAQYLRDFFLRRADLANTLKLVVVSHPHLDHTDGVSELLDAQPALIIENILDNGATDKGSGVKGQRTLQRHAATTSSGYVGLSESDITTTSGVTSSVIDPIDCP